MIAPTYLQFNEEIGPLSELEPAGTGRTCQVPLMETGHIQMK